MLEAVIRVTGKTAEDLVIALEVVSGELAQDYTSGQNRNEDGWYSYAVTGEAEEPDPELAGQPVGRA